MYIQDFVSWRNNKIYHNHDSLANIDSGDSLYFSETLYKSLGIDYPKFFKMDLLSKVAFLSAEILQPDFSNVDTSAVSVALSTTSGCIEVDKKFNKTRSSIPSPSLFVYTLPNIMLAEICIRHGLKGEQVCTIAEVPDLDWMLFYVRDLIEKRNAEACICGHIEATEQNIYATMMWVRKKNLQNRKTQLNFDRYNLKKIFSEFDLG